MDNRISLRPSINRFVYLTDVHAPDCINLDNIFNFIAAFQPQHIIGGGDLFDMTPFNHWVKNKPKLAAELPSVKDYYAECEDVFMGPLRKAVPRGCEFTFIKGNHEVWADKEVIANPILLGDIEVEHRIKGNIRWIPQFEGVWLGNLFFIHGEHALGVHHAKAMVLRYHRNIRYGHIHQIQEHSLTTADGSQITGRSGGTLQRKLPTFMQKRPHDWQYAFGYGWVDSDTGNFTDVCVRVELDGTFIAEGRAWR